MFDMGKRICKLRRDAHLSQKQLGEKNTADNVLVLGTAVKASSSSMNLYSLEFQMHISSEKRLKCIMIVDNADKNSIR